MSRLKFLAAFVVFFAGVVHAEESADQLYNRVRPSLVAVQYTLDTELGRHELIFPGIVVSADGLVMIPLAAVNEQLPDEQMKEFKIFVPRDDADARELPAVFQGRDERSEVAFVRSKDPQKWTPIHFEDAPTQIGQDVYSVGLLPKAAGYRAYLSRGMVGANLRDQSKQILIGGGGLTAIGSPVFNSDGKAIAFVNYQAPFPMWLNEQNPIISLVTPPKFATPSSEFMQSLTDPPSIDHPIKLAWLGVLELSGLKKEEAEYFNLVDQPAVQIGGIASGGPADKAGFQQGDIIVKIDGKPLERTDDPQDLPMLLRRKLLRYKPGSVVNFTLLRTAGQPTIEAKVTLDPRPQEANVAPRYWAEDLGFGVRELVFQDRYALKLKPDEKGLSVTVVKPESSAATARIRPGDLVSQLNGQPVTDLPAFKTAYEDFRKAKPREAVVMVVKREGRQETIRIEPPQ